MVSADRIRAAREMSALINFIKGRYLISGRKPPSTTKITKVMVDCLDREELLRNVFIKF